MYNDFNYEDDFGNDEYEDYSQYGKCEFDTLYLAKGAYTITRISTLRIGGGETLYTFKVERTKYELPKAPSLLDIYEKFENSFLLEFLMSIICDGTMNVRSCKKLVNVNEDEACIICSAAFSIDQQFIKIDDEVESDAIATEVIQIGESQVMRTHQMHYCITQAAKYFMVKLDTISGKKLNWMDDGIDWELVYKNYAEPYIKILMSSFLKTKVDSFDQYKDYMDFNIQFEFERNSNSIYEEIYILPNSVFGRELIYNSVDGRQIMIENKDRMMNGDDFRICMGTQNLALLPIDSKKVYTSVDNGKCFLVAHETSNSTDTYFNRFLLPMSRWSQLPSEMISWLTVRPGFEPCPFIAELVESFDDYNKLKTQEEKDEYLKNHTKFVSTIVTFFSYVNSEEDQIEEIQLGSNGRFIGNIVMTSEEDFTVHDFMNTMEEDIRDPDNLYFPLALYQKFISAYKLPKNVKFMLLPIRALPRYREFMVLTISNDYIQTETQSDIIKEKDDNNSIEKNEKLTFFQSLFGK